ncbi:hypothetical protein MVEN_00182200 [Mycena venus]|uniref:Uncharacterized protein n=1 Tax=Mycena venus TaxID=2733690 RepID=A0A8H6Z3F0_9AGAR|nr:hypothetical protein MVEN_00182200 [Mycena venus]
MRTTILTTAIALAVAATGTAARNCKYGVKYCGSTLRQIGNYDRDMEIALSNHGVRGGEDNTLFECTTIIGNIQMVQYCGIGRCVDGGQGNSDYCQDV